MTNLQLYLAIGIPSILVILSWVSNSLHFNRIDSRLDRIENRVTVIEGDLRQFYSVTGKLEGRLDEISKKH